MYDQEAYRPPTETADDTLASQTDQSLPLRVLAGMMAAIAILPLGPLMWLGMLSAYAYLQGNSPAVWNDRETWRYEFQEKWLVALFLSGLGSIGILGGTIAEVVDVMRKRKSPPPTGSDGSTDSDG